MYNSEKLATYGTQDEEKQSKNMCSEIIKTIVKSLHVRDRMVVDLQLHMEYVPITTDIVSSNLDLDEG
jgi:hypothetical protein